MGKSSVGYVRSSMREHSSASSWASVIQRTAERTRDVPSIEPRFDLLPFIPRTSPQFSQPAHLAPLVDVLTRAFLAARGLGPPVFALVSEPPQVGKTETILHGFAHWLEQCPGDNLAYISYNDDFAVLKSRKARDYAVMSGVELRRDSHSAATWKTTAGGGLIARGILGGSITGQEALKCIVLDDPYKNRRHAESRLIRDRIDGEFRSTIMTRSHPTTSIIVNHTRWHVDDQIGRLVKREPDKWERINLPAITNGVALCEEIHSLEHLLSLRDSVGEYVWQSLYMGQPRTRDAQLFQGIAYYASLPAQVRVAIGVDLAYSSKTSSDWSVAVVMGECNGTYYVIDVVRRQCSAPDFVFDLLRLQKRWPGAPMRGYLAGTERGAADFFKREGVRLHVDNPNGDKFIRAQPFSAAWNHKDANGNPAPRVLIPQDERPWIEPFTSCLLDFTGLNDPHDDDVDAAAAAFDALQSFQGVVIQPDLSHIASRGRPTGLNTRGRSGGAW